MNTVDDIAVGVVVASALGVIIPAIVHLYAGFWIQFCSIITLVLTAYYLLWRAKWVS